MRVGHAHAPRVLKNGGESRFAAALGVIAGTTGTFRRVMLTLLHRVLFTNGAGVPWLPVAASGFIAVEGVAGAKR